MYFLLLPVVQKSFYVFLTSTYGLKVLYVFLTFAFSLCQVPLRSSHVVFYFHSKYIIINQESY